MGQFGHVYRPSCVRMYVELELNRLRALTVALAVPNCSAILTESDGDTAEEPAARAFFFGFFGFCAEACLTSLATPTSLVVVMPSSMPENDWAGTWACFVRFFFFNALPPSRVWSVTGRGTCSVAGSTGSSSIENPPSLAPTSRMIDTRGGDSGGSCGGDDSGSNRGGVDGCLFSG